MSVSILVMDDSSMSPTCFGSWFRRETANSPLDRMTAYQAVLDSRDPGQGLLYSFRQPNVELERIYCR